MKCDNPKCKKEFNVLRKCPHPEAVKKNIINICYSCCTKCSQSEFINNELRCKLHTNENKGKVRED